MLVKEETDGKEIEFRDDNTRTQNCRTLLSMSSSTETSRERARKSAERDPAKEERTVSPEMPPAQQKAA